MQAIAPLFLPEAFLLEWPAIFIQPGETSMQPMLNVALRAARSASELIFRSIERLDVISADEKDAKDFVAELELTVEKSIIQALSKAHPTHGFLGEKTGLTAGKGEGTDYLWIIDPLDGTGNFLRGVPNFSVSIACKYRDRLEHAVILDPVRQEEFTASRGRGAALNGRRMRVSARKGLEGALLANSFPFSPSQLDNLDCHLGMLRDLSGEVAGIRSAGSTSLDLAYIAAGRFDAVFRVVARECRQGAGEHEGLAQQRLG